MVILLISLALAGAAPETPPAPGEQVIVVTGTSLADTERALRECLARHCPPNEDINAALAHAENLFVAGKYEQARDVTHAAIGRNRKFRKTYPIDVSDLYRANSRIAAHLGEPKDFELSSTEMHRILADAFDRKDPRVIGSDLEWADMYAGLGRLERSRQVFEEAEHAAEAAGRPDLAAIARVRAAWLLEVGGDTWQARQQLKKIADDRSPTNHIGRVAALVLLARLDRKEGKSDSSNALIEEMRGFRSKQPVLLFAPNIEMTQRLAEGDAAEGGGGSVTNLIPTENFDDHWVDVGFWVTPAGKVSEPEILRSHGDLGWTKSLLRSISGRIYSPIADSGGTYRVERYTLTSHWMNVTGTRIRQRSPSPRIEYLDLTAEQPAGSR